MPPETGRVFAAPPIGRSIAIGIMVLIFFVSIWSLKSTVQTEAASMIDACRAASRDIAAAVSNGG